MIYNHYSKFGGKTYQNTVFKLTLFNLLHQNSHFWFFGLFDTFTSNKRPPVLENDWGIYYEQYGQTYNTYIYMSLLR